MQGEISFFFLSQLKLTITQIGAWSTKLSVIDLMYKVFRKQKGRKLYFYQPTNHASNLLGYMYLAPKLNCSLFLAIFSLQRPVFD